MRIGFGKADITPELGVELCGYGYYLGRRAKAILDPLYVRAVALEDNKRTLLVANCDLIGLPASMVEAVKSAWQEEFGPNRQDALLLSIHTHSGPATGVLRGCGELDAQYANYLMEKIIEAGKVALRSLAEVISISSFRGNVGGIAWNRVFKEKGPVDSGVYGLVFERSGLRPLVLVNYACHPVTLGRNDEVSADYPGRVVQTLDNAGYEAVFLGGFSGDIDPEINARSWGAGTETTIDEYGRRIAQAAMAAMEKAAPLPDVTLDSFEVEVELPLQTLTDEMVRREMQEAEASRKEHPAYAQVIREWTLAMESQGHETETATVQVLRIGKAILVGFPGETFTKLGLIIKEALPDWHVMTLGNANHVMRYIPVKEDIEARNYAGHDSCRVYDRLPLQPGAGEHLAEAALAAIKERFALEYCRKSQPENCREVLPWQI